MQPTSIILVPGGWHTAFHLGPVIEAFQKQYGATLILPTDDNEYDDQIRRNLSAWEDIDERNSFSSQDDRNADKQQAYRLLPCPLYAAGPKNERHAKFQDDVEAILKLLRSEAEDHQQQMCIVAHSAAGIAALEAINRFFESASTEARARMQHLICVSALCSGRNNASKAGEEAGWISIDSSTGLMHVQKTERYFFNDMSPDDAKPFVDALVPHVKGEAATRAELMTSEAFRDVPDRTYILCSQDAVVPLAFQESEARDHGMRTVSIDTGHCPFVSKPQEFARLIHHIIGGDR